jgi:hypothetical protein
MSHKSLFKRVGRYFWLYCVPVSIVLSCLLPLQGVVRQAMIGALLVWFQMSLMMGMFST